MDIKMLVLSLALVIFIVGYNIFGEKSETEVVEAIEPIETVSEPVEEPVEEINPIKKVYRVTAYCPCEICCGEWAKNRPTNPDGDPIVIGAWGVELVNNFSAASPMAFGTQVELEGIGIVEIQDRTAKWVVEEHGENIIDIYMTNHEEAEKFEVKYVEGVIK